MPAVHFEMTQAIGRVYYHGSYEARSPFHAVFTVLFLGGGKAKLIGAHGTIDMRAVREIAKQLREQFSITHLDMERHGREVTAHTDRVSGFADLT